MVVRQAIAGSMSFGKLRTNVAPLPVGGSHQIRPPCMSISFLQMANPMPIPWVSDREKRENGLNNFTNSSSPMPGPLSLT